MRCLRRQTFVLSDLFVFLAWLLFVSCCACDIRLNQLGLFADGRTYEEELTTINTDPAKTTEALKVSPQPPTSQYHKLQDLQIADIWVGVALLYGSLAY